MAEITDYRNYYLLSRSWQANLLIGKRIEKFGGRASPPVYFCQMISLRQLPPVNRNAEVAWWETRPDSKTFWMISVLKNQVVMAKMKSIWGPGDSGVHPSWASFLHAEWPQQATWPFAPQLPINAMSGLDSVLWFLCNTNGPWVMEWENLLEVDNLRERGGGPKIAYGNLQKRCLRGTQKTTLISRGLPSSFRLASVFPK